MLAAAAKIATAAVSTIVRQLNFGIWRHRKILCDKNNARNKWYFLCRWKGFGLEGDKWEPASSFIHGYASTFIKFLKKHPEIDRELSLIKDCVTKEDLQAQEEAPIVAQPIRDKI